MIYYFMYSDFQSSRPKPFDATSIALSLFMKFRKGRSHFAIFARYVVSRLAPKLGFVVTGADSRMRRDDVFVAKTYANPPFLAAVVIVVAVFVAHSRRAVL